VLDLQCRMADQAMPYNRLKGFRMRRCAVGNGKNYHRAIPKFCNTFPRSSDIARARRHVATEVGRAVLARTPQVLVDADDERPPPGRKEAKAYVTDAWFPRRSRHLHITG